MLLLPLEFQIKFLALPVLFHSCYGLDSNMVLVSQLNQEEKTAGTTTSDTVKGAVSRGWFPVFLDNLVELWYPSCFAVLHERGTKFYTMEAMLCSFFFLLQQLYPAIP